MSDIRFVIAAYGLTWTVFAGYWLRLRAMRRRAERELQTVGGPVDRYAAGADRGGTS